MAIELKDTKILITGASGRVGKQLLHEFNRRGIKPIAHVRKTSDTGYIDSLELEKRFADLRADDQLHKLVEGVECVIHTAGMVDFRGNRLTQFTGINTMAVLSMFKAAQRAGVKKFVHVSTVAAIGAIPRATNGDALDDIERVNEDFEFNLDHLRIPYIMTKHAAEVELAKEAQEGKTELVVVNPSIILAPSRTGNNRTRMLRMFGKFVIPEFPIRVNMVDIRDVAPGIIAALERGRPCERYILAGDNITVRDLVLSVSATIGKIPHLLRLPRPVYDFAARTSQTFGRVFGRSRIRLYPDIVRLLDYDWAYSSSKARQELDYRWRSIYESVDDLLTNNFNDSYMKPQGYTSAD